MYFRRFGKLVSSSGSEVDAKFCDINKTKTIYLSLVSKLRTRKIASTQKWRFPAKQVTVTKEQIPEFIYISQK